MALNSVLEIVTRACDELGLARPGVSGVTGSSAPQDRQMLALLNAAGVDLAAAHDWSSLISTASVAISVAGGASYSLPSDFNRVIENTGWDQTNHFPLVGNLSPQRHQFWLSASVVGVTTRQEFRLTIGNNASTIYIHPTPTASDTLSFLYVKKNWATDSAGATPADTIATDNDLTLFKPELIVKEIKWRFRAAKGLDATALKMECDAYRELLIARDLGTGAIDMGGPLDIAPIDFLGIPDGNWNI